MALRALSSRQRRHIRQVIRDGHLAFLAEMFGPSAIDQDDYVRLRAAGKIRDDKLMPQDVASAAHAVGSIAGHELVGALDAPHSAGSAAARALPGSADEFWQQVRDDPQVVTEAEREAVAILRDHIGQHVRDLGSKLENAVGHALIEAEDADRRRRLARGAAGSSPAASALQDAMSGIRAAVTNLRRDWVRVVHTEVHNAAEEAKAVVIAGHVPGRDPRVFKRTRADACEFCRLLFLKPDGVTPRVFRLSTLLANGTNVGRRAGQPTRSGRSRTQWRAVVGSVHPHCGCELFVLPDGSGFDSRGHVVHVGVKKSTSIEVEIPDEDLINHECEE